MTRYLDYSGLSYLYSKIENIFQPKLVSGTSIRTINNVSLLGAGNINIEGSGGGGSSNIIGEIKQFAGATIPTGWLECDGSEVSVNDYPVLYSVIGNLWGTPSDSSHFVLPNFKGKVPVGYDSSDTDFDTVGESGGAKAITLTGNQSGVKTHSHGFNANFIVRHGSTTDKDTVNGGTNAAYSRGGSSQTWGQGITTTSFSHHPDVITINGGVANATAQNASEAHSNLQPYAVVKYIIYAS